MKKPKPVLLISKRWHQLLLLVFFIYSSPIVFAQTAFEAYSPAIGTTTCPGSDVEFNAGVYEDLPPGVAFSGFTRVNVGCNNAGSHYRSIHNSTSKASAVSDEKFVKFSFTASSSVEFEVSELAIAHSRSNQGSNNGAIHYAVGNNNFVQMDSDFIIGTNDGRSVLTFANPVSIPSGDSIVFRMYGWANGGPTGNGNVRIRGGSNYNISTGLKGEFTITATDPEISVAPTVLSQFCQVMGNPSGEQSVTVQGFNLTDDLTITAPADFEISLTSGS
ncbi:MAG: hypothetical protein EA392_00350, partial [Cryomorphaceae bacterium]